MAPLGERERTFCIVPAWCDGHALVGGAALTRAGRGLLIPLVGQADQTGAGYPVMQEKLFPVDQCPKNADEQHG